MKEFGQLDLATRKGGVKARNQLFIIERLGQKTKRSGRQRFRADFCARECRDEDNWQWVPLLSQAALQLKAVYAWHLDIGEQAGGVTESVRLQEGFPGRECFGCLTQHQDEPPRVPTSGFGIVDH